MQREDVQGGIRAALFRCPWMRRTAEGCYTHLKRTGGALARFLAHGEGRRGSCAR